MTTPAIRIGYAVVVAFIACAAIAFASVAYSSHVQRETDKKWCTLMVTLDEAYSGAQKPTTPLGQRVAAAIHDLRTDLDCPPG